MPEFALMTAQAFEAEISKPRRIDHSCDHGFSYPLLEPVTFFRFSCPSPQFVGFPLLSRFIEKTPDHFRFCRSERSHFTHSRLNARIACSSSNVLPVVLKSGGYALSEKSHDQLTRWSDPVMRRIAPMRIVPA